MWTTNNLSSEFQSKSIKYKEAFVKAANDALKRGRTQAEAEFVGKSAVARLETIDARKASEDLKQDVQKRQPPPHLAAVLRARQVKQSLVVQKAEQPVASPNLFDTPEIVEVFFDEDGKIVMKLSNGKILRSKNRSPVTENVTQHITITSPTVETTTGGADFLSEFSDENELDRTMIYSGGNLSRINYQSGNYKTFEYNEDGTLFRANYFKSDNKNYRKTFYYNSNGDIASVDYEVIDPEPIEFTGFFVQQYSEPQQLVFSGNFIQQYSIPPEVAFGGVFGPQYG